mmetsp:Transcript_22071/g.31951  ORF Transcript_22071/g.31951 Transcript_22071/m.31951 type:complete len:86 (-) Transcript_22071:66-323(-)
MLQQGISPSDFSLLIIVEVLIALQKHRLLELPLNCDVLKQLLYSLTIHQPCLFLQQQNTSKPLQKARTHLTNLRTNKFASAPDSH